MKSTSSSTFVYGQNWMTADPAITTVSPVAVRVSPGTMYLPCGRSRKRHVSMRRRWALEIFSLLSCCGLRTSSNNTSYAYRDAVRNLWKVRSERGTDRYGVLYDIPYDLRVVQRAFCECVDFGPIDPSTDDVPDGLAQGQGYGRRSK